MSFIPPFLAGNMEDDDDEQTFVQIDLEAFERELKRKESQGIALAPHHVIPPYIAPAFPVQPTSSSSRGRGSREGPLAPRSAFLLFSNEKRRTLNLPTSEKQKELQKMWAALSADERLPYKNMELQDKERYRIENEAYLKSRGGGGGGSDGGSASDEETFSSHADAVKNLRGGASNEQSNVKTIHKVAPISARSAFILFSKEKRKQIDLPGPEKTKELQRLWAAMSPEERAPYKMMELEDKERFRIENEEFMAYWSSFNESNGGGVGGGDGGREKGKSEDGTGSNDGGSQQGDNEDVGDKRKSLSSGDTRINFHTSASTSSSASKKMRSEVGGASSTSVPRITADLSATRLREECRAREEKGYSNECKEALLLRLGVGTVSISSYHPDYTYEQLVEIFKNESKARRDTEMREQSVLHTLESAIHEHKLAPTHLNGLPRKPRCRKCAERMLDVASDLGLEKSTVSTTNMTDAAGYKYMGSRPCIWTCEACNFDVCDDCYNHFSFQEKVRGAPRNADNRIEDSTAYHHDPHLHPNPHPRLSTSQGTVYLCYESIGNLSDRVDTKVFAVCDTLETARLACRDRAMRLKNPYFTSTNVTKSAYDTAYENTFWETAFMSGSYDTAYFHRQSKEVCKIWLEGPAVIQTGNGIPRHKYDSSNSSSSNNHSNNNNINNNNSNNNNGGSNGGRSGRNGDNAEDTEDEDGGEYV